MTKDGLCKEEKAILAGMMAVLDIDICAYFDCPDEGCEECPLNEVLNKKAEFYKTVNEVLQK